MKRRVLCVIAACLCTGAYVTTGYGPALSLAVVSAAFAVFSKPKPGAKSP